MKKEAVKLRTIFMGTSFFAEKMLSSLLDAQYNVISVYTRPDKKVGREQKLQKSPVKILAEEKKIPVFEPAVFEEKTIEEIKQQKPDIIIVAAYGRILPKKVLEIPGFGCINVHASLLPKFRGPSPIQNAILTGEKTTGVTIMLMDEGMDTGDILAQQETEIGKDETYPELLEKLSQIGATLLLRTLPHWAERKITAWKQDASKATLCQLIERADGRIIWAEDAKSIYNRYRAFYPWPGIYTFWENGGTINRIKLNKINIHRIDPETKHHLGEVFQLGGRIGVQTQKGIIILEEIQLEGKSNMKIDDFRNGYLNFVGSTLK